MNIFQASFCTRIPLGYVLCLGSLCFTYLSLKLTPRWPYIILLLAIFPILLFAKSTTSVALYLCILSMPFVYLLCRQVKLRVIIILSLICAAVLIFIFLELFELSLIDIALELAGKGRDISGRTSLWSLAITRFSERPWSGVGYHSFWTSTQFMNDVNWVHGLISDTIGHFHNAWLESLVNLGIPGAALMAVVPVSLLVVLVPRLFGTNCSAIDIAGVYLVLVVLVRSNVEASLYFQHQSENIAMISLLVSLLLNSSNNDNNNSIENTEAGKIQSYKIR